MVYYQEQSRSLMNCLEGGPIMNWEQLNDNTIQDYIDSASYDAKEKYNCDYLDVSETISELAYLTHDYFRYYGKFPSKVAKYIIDYVQGKGVISPQTDFIFDNYNGSGTRLLKQKLLAILPEA